MFNVTNTTVITDLSISFDDSTAVNSTKIPELATWHRIDKDLYLHSGTRCAYLTMTKTQETELTSEHLVITDITVGQRPGEAWERRPAGIWILRRSYAGNISEVVTGVDALFGVDAVDPRPQWHLDDELIRLNDAPPDIPVARLSIRRGRFPLPRDDPPVLRVKQDGTFRIVQISDTHMVTGVGSCKDSIDANGNFLPESVADPLTVKFIEEVLDMEKPDLVLLTGDQVHHDIHDTQSALYKVVAPLITRAIPFAAVFGNHDSEGAYALSREAQMSILEDLPYSLCQAGPKELDGIGNHYLQVIALKQSVLDIFLLDSHEQIKSIFHDPDYAPIKQNQIDWFKATSQALRERRPHHGEGFHSNLVFLHIPIPEFGRDDLITTAGTRHEPTEGPSQNTHFYDALVEEGVAAIACGHDHVNDFCAQLPQMNASARHRPWLCYGGGTGFGGYCSYGKERFHRRTRVWELDTKKETLKTWKRVEYAKERVDELVLVDGSDDVLSATDTRTSDNDPVGQVVL